MTNSSANKNMHKRNQNGGIDPQAVASNVESFGGNSPEEKQRITNLEKQLQELKKDCINLANNYIGFQGIILTAFFSAPSHLKCQYWKFPFFLSFIAGFLNISALLGKAPDYIRWSNELDDISANSFRRETGRLPRTQRARITNRLTFLRTAYVFLCFFLVFAFFIVTLSGCYGARCHDFDSFGIRNRCNNYIMLCDAFNSSNCIGICPNK